MPPLRLTLLLVTVLLHAPAGHANDEVAVCKLLRQQLWTTTGHLSLSACASELGARGDVYENSSVRFGFWGQTLLADTGGRGVYRSENGGQNWKPAFGDGLPSCGICLGIPSLAGSALVASAGEPTSTEPPVPVPPPAPATPPVPVATAAAPLVTRSEAAAPNLAPPPSARSARIAEEPAEIISAGNRGRCDLKQDGQWHSQMQQTLAQCMALLEALPRDPDAKGMQQAYWDGSYLAADRSTVYRSADGRTWTRLRARRMP